MRLQWSESLSECLKSSVFQNFLPSGKLKLRMRLQWSESLSERLKSSVFQDFLPSGKLKLKESLSERLKSSFFKIFTRRPKCTFVLFKAQDIHFLFIITHGLQYYILKGSLICGSFPENSCKKQQKTHFLVDLSPNDTNSVLLQTPEWFYMLLGCFIWLYIDWVVVHLPRNAGKTQKTLIAN